MKFTIDALRKLQIAVQCVGLEHRTATMFMPRSRNPRNSASVDCTAISFKLVRPGASMRAEMVCALIASVAQATELSAWSCENRLSRLAAVSAFESSYFLHQLLCLIIAACGCCTVDGL